MGPSQPPPIAVTMGEPAGIGGEIALKAWLRRQPNTHPYFCVDDPNRLTALASKFGLTVPIAPIAAPRGATLVFERALPVLPLSVPPSELGNPSDRTAPAVIASIDRAIDFATMGEAAAVVTAPIQKHVMQGAGFGFPGHTEYLGHRCGGQRAIMMLAVETTMPPLRVVPVTVHLPLAEVAKTIRRDDIVAAGMITAAALKRDFGIERPRVAVAALNPHGGEAGIMGKEELGIIAPAVTELRQAGVAAAGPFPADTLFHAAARRDYDAVICMYHDQALIPLKTLDFSGGVNVTLGLPIVRTSPDHGTALDIAARGVADPASMIAALGLAGKIAELRSRAV